MRHFTRGKLNQPTTGTALYKLKIRQIEVLSIAANQATYLG